MYSSDDNDFNSEDENEYLDELWLEKDTWQKYPPSVYFIGTPDENLLKKNDLHLLKPNDIFTSEQTGDYWSTPFSTDEYKRILEKLKTLKIEQLAKYEQLLPFIDGHSESWLSYNKDFCLWDNTQSRPLKTNNTSIRGLPFPTIQARWIEFARQRIQKNTLAFQYSWLSTGLNYQVYRAQSRHKKNVERNKRKKEFRRYKREHFPIEQPRMAERKLTVAEMRTRRNQTRSRSRNAGRSRSRSTNRSRNTTKNMHREHSNYKSTAEMRTRNEQTRSRSTNMSRSRSRSRNRNRNTTENTRRDHPNYHSHTERPFQEYRISSCESSRRSTRFENCSPS